MAKERLKQIIKKLSRDSSCISRQNARFYLQRASYYWKQFCDENPQSVATLLVVYQSLLSGIHLMKTGSVLSNLSELCQAANASHAQRLIEEASRGGSIDVEYHEREYRRLVAELESATAESEFPEQPSEVPALDQMLTFSRSYLPLEEA